MTDEQAPRPAPPPIDNAHVAPGCEQFSPATVAEAKVVPLVTQAIQSGPWIVTVAENEAKAVLGPAVSTWLHDFYNTNKWLFYTIIPLAIVVMLVIKFHDIIIDLLLGDAKKLNADAVKKDAALAAQANKTKAEGDAFVNKANNEGKNAPPVADDWFKK